MSLRLFCLLIPQITCVSLNLLKLKSFWLGNGVGLIYPNSMSLLSNKLKKQSSLLISENFVSTGNKWEIKAQLTLKCLSLNNFNQTENLIGVGLFLTKSNPRASIFNYNFDEFQDTFGMTSKFDGVALIFTQNNLYIKMNPDKKWGKNEFMQTSLVCKAYLMRETQIKFRLSFSYGLLSVYTSNLQENKDTFCASISLDIDFLNEIFISLSASDVNSKCSAKVPILEIDSQTLFSKINNPKNDNDKFVFFGDETSSTHLNSVLDFHKQSAQILSEQLLIFANRDEREVVKSLEHGLTMVEHLVENAVHVVETETHQLEILNSLLNTERKNLKKDGEHLTEELLNWLTQVEVIFIRVDKQSQTISENLEKLNVSGNFISLIKKIQNVQNELENSLARTDLMNDSEWLKDLSPKKLKKAKKAMGQFNQQLLSVFDLENLKSFQFWKFLFIGLISILSIAVFVYVYSKIRKIAMTNRHI